MVSVCGVSSILSAGGIEVWLYPSLLSIRIRPFKICLRDITGGSTRDYCQPSQPLAIIQKHVT